MPDVPGMDKPAQLLGNTVVCEDTIEDGCGHVNCPAVTRDQ
jgi:hypothetical protein